MRILYVASVSYAGMLPYASSIINAMKHHDVYCVLVNSKYGDYKSSIDQDLLERCYFIDQYNSSILLNLEFVFPFRVSKLIEKVCDIHAISNIHFLTSDNTLSQFIYKRNIKYNFYYTVHDLVQHEEKVSFFLGLKRRIAHQRFSKIRSIVYFLSTNSWAQFSQLKNMYPNKDVRHFKFPTLVTSSIKSGTRILPELVNVDNYILFFGRIEKYKGLDILLDAYCSNIELANKSKLVIAGRGRLDFDQSNDNIIFINRYIYDEEIASLFQNSYCTIYPYRSATQSGVLSLSYYFGKPVIVSNIPFFKENVLEGVTGFSFVNGDSKKLGNAINTLQCSKDMSTIAIKKYYDNLYSQDSLQESLESLYV